MPEKVAQRDDDHDLEHWKEVTQPKNKAVRWRRCFVVEKWNEEGWNEEQMMEKRTETLQKKKKTKKEEDTTAYS